MQDCSGIIQKAARSFALHDEDDLRQELLVALWQSIPSYRGDCKPSTFVYRVTHNYALTWARTQANYRKKLERYGQEPSPGPSRESELLERLYQVIRQLPQVDRSPALLYLDDLSYSEMSKILGMSESSIGVRLHRLKQRLSEQFEEEKSGAQ